MDKISDLKLWIIFFFYTCLVSVFVQFILLPYVLPGFHAGSGLLNCSFDSIGFHKLAVELADKIRAQGWSAWQLRPNGNAPAGIASIFYVLILPDPRALIPLSAALHASAALVLVNMLNLFVKNTTKAALCVLPFLIFPSSLQWIAQWHRDGFSILGVILVLQGTVLLARSEDHEIKNRFFIFVRPVLFCICGFILIWLVRSYMLTIILPFVGLNFSLLFFILLAKAAKNKFLLGKTLAVFLCMLLLLTILVLMRLAGFKDNTAEFGYTGRLNAEKTSIKNTGADPVKLVTTDSIRKEGLKKYDVENSWKRAFWLTPFIENKIYNLALIRRNFRHDGSGAKSNIDSDIGFGSAKDVLLYLPRAAQIAFLAPFPNQWLSKGTYQASSLMRKVSACEMIVVYFALLFLPYSIWHWRKRVEIWIIFIFCSYMLLVHALVVCNIGTLYRMRYPYITTLVALGIAGFTVFLDSMKIKSEQKAR